MGFCGTLRIEHFSGFVFFCSQAESTLTQRQSTQTVGHFVSITKKSFRFQEWNMAQLSSKPSDSLFASLTKDASASIITGLMGYFLASLFGLSDDLKTAAVGASVLIGSLLVTFTKNRVMTYSRDIGKKYMEERTGIAEVFNNLESCKTDMQAEFKKANNIRLLLQIGRREIGESDASYFGVLAREKNQPNAKIRVLRASKESPFMSEERAKVRGANIRRWREDIRRLANEIDILRDELGIKIEDREHSEPFLWRIFLFDDVAYISAYLHQSDNDQKAVVYKLIKSEKSLYAIFDKYFEYLWAKGSAGDSTASTLEWAKQS